MSPLSVTAELKTDTDRTRQKKSFQGQNLDPQKGKAKFPFPPTGPSFPAHGASPPQPHTAVIQQSPKDEPAPQSSARSSQAASLWSYWFLKRCSETNAIPFFGSPGTCSTALNIDVGDFSYGRRSGLSWAALCAPHCSPASCLHAAWSLPEHAVITHGLARPSLALGDRQPHD